MSPFLMRVSLFCTRCRFFVLSLCVLCLDLRSTRNRSRDQRDTFSQRPKFQSQKTQICFHFVFFFPSKIKLLFLQTRTATTGLSLSLSLSLLRSHRHVRSRFVRALFALKCEGHKCLFPSSKGRKNYYLGCSQTLN